MLFRSPSPLNPLGVKGVGEGGTIPAAAALISAVEDALSPFGVRIDHYPLTPRKLVELIRRGSSGSGCCLRERVRCRIHAARHDCCEVVALCQHRRGAAAGPRCSAAVGG